MNYLKTILICLFTVTVCFVSCTKQELQNESETFCVKSDFSLQPSGNETYPLILGQSDYPFQYAINQNDIDDFFSIVNHYLAFVSQNGCVVMSMDSNGTLLRYGIYDVFFDMEQLPSDTIIIDDGGGQTISRWVWVHVGTICSRNYSEIKAWAHQKMAEGCTVVIQYNRNTGEYGAFAYAKVEAVEVGDED